MRFVLDASVALAAVPLLWHEDLADVLLRCRRAKDLSAAKLEEALALLRTLPTGPI